VDSGVIEDDAQCNAVPRHTHEVENDAGEFEVIRMILECLDRFDMVSSGGGAKFVDILDGVEGGHNLDGGGDDRTVEEDMAKLLEESKTLLYAGCSTNRLVAILLLLNYFACLVCPMHVQMKC
jgi:hypothetical protein